MTYYREPLVAPLVVRTINMYPTSYANFKISCMTKDCKDGGFELNAVVDKMVKSRVRKSNGSIPCAGSTDTLSTCRTRIEYEAVIEYHS